MAYGLNAMQNRMMPGQLGQMNPAMLQLNAQNQAQPGQWQGGQLPDLIYQRNTPAQSGGCASGKCGTPSPYGSSNNMPKSANFWRGSPSQILQNQLLTPEQQKAMSEILQYGLSQYKNPQAGYEPFAEAARKNLFEQTLPSIAERFNLMGKGAATSGAFQGMLARAGSDLESQLAQGAANYGLQRQGYLTNLLQTGLGRSYENVYKPREASGFESTIPGVFEAIAKVAPFFFL